MVKKLFWENPYQTALDTKIAGVDGDVITLDETIFFAFSGGQQSDDGKIGGFPVISANKENKEIFYTLPSEHNLKAGDDVAVEIDWEKRYRLMRLHFAAELVLELVYQTQGRPQKIGANITSDKARLDFVWEGNISQIFPELTQRLNELISANLPIKSEFSDEQNEKRCWDVEGFSRVPCGGTHLKMTGEVGSVRLKRVNIGQGKERIEIYLC